MRTYINIITFICIFNVNSFLFSQSGQSHLLFQNENPLSLELEYSNKQVKKETDKNNLISTNLIYEYNTTRDTIPVLLRARGNFRRTNCYFSPLKMQLKKGAGKGTLFLGHKKLKIVLPCLLQGRSNDDILKEYLAYKIYEQLSEVHFKTRLVNIEYVDTRGKKSEIHPLTALLPKYKLDELYNYEGEEAFAFRKPKKYKLTAILIEDDKIVAKRHNAKIMKRFVHPLNQGEKASIKNAFFQFMIGNTDFSTAYGHNQKLMFLNKKAVPLPYDFDMSGLVDASYSVVSNINNQDLPITEVTQRLYRGFKRNIKITQLVRAEFLEHKEELLKIVDETESAFEDKKSYQKTKSYVQGFFKILENESRFKNEILDKARIK